MTSQGQDTNENSPALPLPHPSAKKPSSLERRAGKTGAKTAAAKTNTGTVTSAETWDPLAGLLRDLILSECGQLLAAWSQIMDFHREANLVTEAKSLATNVRSE